MDVVGACPVCGGLGKIIGIDESLVIPNQALSVYQDAVACWKGEVMKYFKEEVLANADKFGFPVHTPYKDLTAKQKSDLWNGNRYITGIYPFFKELEAKRYKIQNKYMISRYSGKTVCRECGGSRLRREALYVRIGGCKLPAYEEKIAARALKEIRDRLDYIDHVGLSYLTLNRASNTLSGGESQRISIVCSLGNSLTGSMYILDEPSIGLHSRDTGRLIEVIRRLRDLGNTVIVVEHDEEIIRSADWLIDIGPRAGKHGGEVVYCGPPPASDISETDASALLAAWPRSLTLEYLLGRKKISISPVKRPWKQYIEVCDACENNLKNIDRHDRRHRSQRLGQVHPRGRHPLPCPQPHAQPGGCQTRLVPGTARRPGPHILRGVRGPEPDRPQFPLQPGDLHQGIRRHPQALLRAAAGQGQRLRPLPFLLQHRRRPLPGMPR